MFDLPHWLTDEIAISGQISPDNVVDIKKMGFKSIICNRPDFESDSAQPTKASIEEEAKKLGVFFEFFPVASTNHTEAEVSQMATHLINVPKPVLVYCRTGGRSSALIGRSIHLGLFKP
jgi:sulfide:quinone oxidoreductase